MTAARIAAGNDNGMDTGCHPPAIDAAFVIINPVSVVIRQRVRPEVAGPMTGSGG
jgi:hypothetical protein